MHGQLVVPAFVTRSVGSRSKGIINGMLSCFVKTSASNICSLSFFRSNVQLRDESWAHSFHCLFIGLIWEWHHNIIPTTGGMLSVYVRSSWLLTYLKRSYNHVALQENLNLIETIVARKFFHGLCQMFQCEEFGLRMLEG